MSSTADVTVVVGNYEGASVLPDCLESLRAQTRPPRAVLVVDAESTDDSRAVADRHGVDFLVTENRGLGHLYNVGARAAATAYVLLTNNDVAFDSRCIELLAAALDEDAQRFAADPRQVDWSGDRLVHARVLLRRSRLFHELLPGYHLDMTVPAEAPSPTVTANGGAMLVRRDLMLELGGFDETFFMDFEDIDLCWRAWLRGWPSVYQPDAWLRHRVGAVTTSRELPRRLRSSHHNLVRFALKCFPPGAALLVVVGELLRLPRHPREIAPALCAVVAELPEILAQRRRARPSRRFMQWVLAGMP